MAYNPPTTPESSVNNIVYPNDLLNTQRNFCMQFNFTKYVRYTLALGATITPTGTSMTLQMPLKINDAESVVWEDVSLTSVGAGIISAGLGLKAASDFSGAIKSRLQSSGKTGTVLAESVGSLATSKVGLQDINAALSFMGETVNPFLTLLFKQPTFKKHMFVWKFSPETKQDSDTVNQIIRTFRINMLPSLSGFGLFLSYPNFVNISFIPDGYLYRLKPCVISDMQVDYTPLGPSFFTSSKAPTIVTLAVNFIEVEYWLSTDPDLNY